MTISGKFEFWSNNELVLCGKVTTEEEDEAFDETDVVDLKEDSVKLDENEIYDELKYRGYNHTGLFRIIKQMSITEQGNSIVVNIK